MLNIEYRENEKRGSADFPIQLYHVDKHHPQYRMVCHWHYDFEIIVVKEGSFEIKLDDKSYILNQGDIAFIVANVLHSGIPHNCVYDCIVFNPELLRHRDYQDDNVIKAIVHKDIILKQVIRSNELDSFSLLKDSIYLVIDELTNDNPDALLVTAGLRVFFSSFIKNKLYEEDLILQEHGMSKTSQIRKALEYIESKYNQKLTLEEVADVVGLSPKYFCSFFLEMTGQTLFQYINSLRCEKASILLKDKKLSVIDVAMMVGLNDPAYFSRVFKKYIGTTPKAYKNSIYSPKLCK